MPNCLTASVLFRAYVKRLPSGVFRVTVLSAALPRPVFRSYPLDIGEAVAVERSVGHALELLPAVNVVIADTHPCTLPTTPHGNDRVETNCAEQAESSYPDVKHELRHGSPHRLHQPCNNAAVSSEEQEGTDGYAVKSGHLALYSVNDCISEIHAPHSQVESPTPRMLDIAVDRRRTEHQHAEQSPQPTPHLTLRVVWQGLLV